MPARTVFRLSPPPEYDPRDEVGDTVNMADTGAREIVYR